MKDENKRMESEKSELQQLFNYQINELDLNLKKVCLHITQIMIKINFKFQHFFFAMQLIEENEENSDLIQTLRSKYEQARNEANKAVEVSCDLTRERDDLTKDLEFAKQSFQTQLDEQLSNKYNRVEDLRLVQAELIQKKSELNEIKLEFINQLQNVSLTIFRDKCVCGSPKLTFNSLISIVIRNSTMYDS